MTGHRENIAVTQTTPGPTLLSWGGWPRENFFPNPWPHCKPSLIALIGHLDPIILKPFDLAQVCHGNKICSKLALTWKLTLELTFPAHWKFNGISRTNISKVTLNAANECVRCSRGQWCMTDPPAGPGGWVKLCRGTWKLGPESLVGVISLCQQGYFYEMLRCMLYTLGYLREKPSF